MNNPNNKTLLYLLIIAITISLTGTFISLNKLGTTTTGMVSTEGVLSIEVSAKCSINTETSTVNFGAGYVNASYNNCTIQSNGTTGSGCVNFSTVSSGLAFQNVGNKNMSVTINSNETASSLIGGGGTTTPQFKGKANSGETACNETGSFWNGWVDLNSTNQTICSGSNELEPTSNADDFEIDLQLIIPDDAQPGTRGATITLTGTC